MSDEFDPNWPHGHLLKWASGGAERVRILATDLPREYPIAACFMEGPEIGAIRCFKPDGSANGIPLRLINAPAPVKHAEAWVNVWRRADGSVWYGSRHDDGPQDAHEGAKHYIAVSKTSTYVGAQRWRTDGTGGDIIGPNGEKVKL